MDTAVSKFVDLEDSEIKSMERIHVKDSFIYRFYSRTLDIVSSFIGLLIGIPLVIIFGFYKQERLGKDEKHFSIYKLRSMRVDAEKIGGAQWAQKNDPRITKVGNFIRKTRIDEIPQLVNILKGDMSLIGPRPERPELTYEFDKEIPGFLLRTAVKPGLTGLAQVNGGYEISPEEKLKWDIEYIKNRNILMDLKILFATVRVVLTGEGAR